MDKEEIYIACSEAIQKGIYYAKRVQSTFERRARNESSAEVAKVLLNEAKNTGNDIIEMSEALTNLNTL